MAASWTVIAQRQSEELTPQGTFESVVDVTFQLASGTTGSVKIPARLYSADYVSEQVATRASEMMAVERLSGP